MSQLLNQLLEINIEDITIIGVPDLWHILWAIIIFLLGRWVARRSRKWFLLAVHRTDFKLNKSLVRLIDGMIYYGILLVAITLSMTSLGIPIESLLSIIALIAILLAIALQTSLSNFAATIIFTVFQTYKPGDWIEVTQGTFGQVKELQMFSTVLITQDRSTVVIPNGQIIEGNIYNYSSLGYRRADMVFTVTYQDDLLKAKKILEDILATNEYVLEDPKPIVGVLQLGDKGVDFSLRPFAKAEHYWDAIFAISEAAKMRFDEAGITLAIPRQELFLPERNTE